jgi:hypothetical protein
MYAWFLDPCTLRESLPGQQPIALCGDCCCRQCAFANSSITLISAEWSNSPTVHEHAAKELGHQSNARQPAARRLGRIVNDAQVSVV